MRFLAPLLGVSLLAAAALPALAETRTVPSDAHPTIQSAVDASADGDVIVVKARVYAENVLVSGRDNLTLIGKGKPVIDGGGSGPCIRVTETAGVRITGFVFRDGSDAAVSVDDSYGFTLEKCLVDGGPGDGVSIGEGCAFATVLKTLIRGVARHGVRSYRTTSISIGKCRIEDTGINGISLAAFDGVGSAKAVVWKNRISRAAGGAIVGGGSQQVIEGNSIASGVGIYSDPSTRMNGSRVEGNRVTAPFNSGGAGIAVEGDSVQVLGNKTKYSTWFGIWVSGVDNRVERNSVKATRGTGIQVEGDAPLVLANRVTASSGHGCQVSGPGATVQDNRVLKSADYGIHMTAGGGTVTGNVALKNEIDFVDLDGTNAIGPNRFGTTQIFGGDE